MSRECVELKGFPVSPAEKMVRRCDDCRFLQTHSCQVVVVVVVVVVVARW